MRPVALEISDDMLSELRQIGLSVLKQERIRASVALMDVKDETLFGIIFESPEGNEWYTGDEDFQRYYLGWTEQQDAQFYLDQKVLPDIGMSAMIETHREQLANFQSMLN